MTRGVGLCLAFIWLGCAIADPSVCFDGWSTSRAPSGEIERSELWQPDPELRRELTARAAATNVLCWHRYPISGRLMLIDGDRCHNVRPAGSGYRFVDTEQIVTRR